MRGEGGAYADHLSISITARARHMHRITNALSTADVKILPSHCSRIFNTYLIHPQALSESITRQKLKSMLHTTRVYTDPTLRQRLQVDIPLSLGAQNRNQGLRIAC